MVVKHVMCEYVQCRSCDTVQPLFDDREHALYFSDDDATDGRSHDNFSEALSYVPETIESVLIVEGDVVARAAYSPFGKAHGELMWFVQIDKEGDA